MGATGRFVMSTPAAFRMIVTLAVGVQFFAERIERPNAESPCAGMSESG